MPNLSLHSLTVGPYTPPAQLSFRIDVDLDDPGEPVEEVFVVLSVDEPLAIDTKRVKVVVRPVQATFGTRYQGWAYQDVQLTGKPAGPLLTFVAARFEGGGDVVERCMFRVKP